MDALTTATSPIPSEQRRAAAANFERANQVIASGNLDYAVQLLLLCCKIDPGNLLYRQTLRRTQKGQYKDMHGSRMASVTTLPNWARLKNAKRGGEHLTVLEAGEQILSKNPWDTKAQLDMAVAAEALGLLDMAIFILDQAREKNPKDASVNRPLARLFEKRGNFNHAISLWQLVSEANPSDAEASSKAKDLAASETIQRGQYEQSLSGERTALHEAHGKASTGPVDRSTRELAAVQARVEAHPTDPVVYLQLAAAHQNVHQIEPAREALQKGLTATGGDFRIRLALMELDLEPFRENLKIAEAKNRQLREDPEAYDGPNPEELHKIRHKLLKEIVTREVEWYRLKADRFPQDVSNHLELGTRLLQLGQLDEAIVELQQARRDPRLAAKSLLMLGNSFRKRNNWRLAQRNFEDGLAACLAEDEASRKDLLYQLARGHAEEGDLVKAIDFGHELANIDFGFKDIRKLLDEWQKKVQEA